MNRGPNRSPLLLLAFVAAAIALPIARGTATDVRRETEIHPGVTEIEFSSRVLGTVNRFCVVEPAAAAHGNDGWPVLFFLHGRGRTHRSLVDVEPIRRAFLDAPFCTIFPEGDDGWYIDSPVQPESRYESYLEEVIAIAGRARPLTRARDCRAIAGWSMGGYGAVRFAMRHPDEFGVVAAIIGLLDFPRPADLPAGQNYTVPTPRFGAEPAVWSRFNPLNHAEALRGRAIFIVTAADAFDRTMNEHFHARLRALEIPHEYLVLPGSHTFAVVQEAVPRVIAFVARHFAVRGSAAPPTYPTP